MSGKELPALGLVAFRSEGTDYALESRRVAAARPSDPKGGRGTSYSLALEPGGGSLAVEGPLEFLEAPPAELLPLPEALKARCAIPGLRAFVRSGERLLLLLDPPGPRDEAARPPA